MDNKVQSSGTEDDDDEIDGTVRLALAARGQKLVCRCVGSVVVTWRCGWCVCVRARVERRRRRARERQVAAVADGRADLT